MHVLMAPYKIALTQIPFAFSFIAADLVRERRSALAIWRATIVVFFSASQVLQRGDTYKLLF